jgi:hypothetical protein
MYGVHHRDSDEVLQYDTLDFDLDIMTPNQRMCPKYAVSVCVCVCVSMRMCM